MTGWHPCLKRSVTCTLVLDGKALVIGSNICNSSAGEVCARELLRCAGGEHMELCGPPRHAEARAASRLRERFGDIAYLSGEVEAHVRGNDWVCRECQRALLAAGINRIVIHGR